jgi:hypothetical protein
MKIYMFVILDMAKPDTENIRGLNLEVVSGVTVQVIKLVLQPELHLTEQNLLYPTWTKRGLVYVLYTQNYRYIMQYYAN